MPGRVRRGLASAQQGTGIQIECAFQPPLVERADDASVVNDAIVKTRSDSNSFTAGELGGFDSGWNFHAATVPYSGRFAKSAVDRACFEINFGPVPPGEPSRDGGIVVAVMRQTDAMLRGSVQAPRVPPILKNALKGKSSAIDRVGDRQVGLWNYEVTITLGS